MAKRLFVTGLGGFVGYHVRRHVAVDPNAYELVEPVDFDVRDRASIARALEGIEPDWVIHLAAQSSVAQSIIDPRATHETNYFGTLNLLEALSATGFRGRLLHVGSGDQYGLVSDSDLPVRETQQLRPRNPYAASKAAAEALCYQYSQAGRFEIVLARPFNSIGPRQSTRFAIADFARQIAEMALGKRPTRLEGGDFDVSRDFTDVRDVVGAYCALLVYGENGEPYNVCSGRDRVLRDLVSEMARIAGIDVELTTDPARLRRGEQRRIVGDPTKLQAATGWSPVIPIEATLRDTIDDWMRRLR